MHRNNFKAMSVDELWEIHEEIAALLSSKMTAEKMALEKRLSQIQHHISDGEHPMSAARKPYPRVPPKFRNPEQPSETWAGRGRTPRWMKAQLQDGKEIKDFLIKEPA
jgi:DNA-binding protein H-NS